MDKMYDKGSSNKLTKANPQKHSVEKESGAKHAHGSYKPAYGEGGNAGNIGSAVSELNRQHPKC